MRTKEEIVKTFSELYNSNNYVVIVDYKGMNVEDTSSFRGELKQKCGAKMFVVKNTLNKKSAIGTDYDGNINLKGQCAVVFCNDLLNVSKVVHSFCFEKNKAKLVGCFNKKDVVTEDQFKELASLPSIEVLRATFVYLLNSVGSSLVYTIIEKVKKEGFEIDA